MCGAIATRHLPLIAVTSLIVVQPRELLHTREVEARAQQFPAVCKDPHRQNPVGDGRRVVEHLDRGAADDVSGAGLTCRLRDVRRANRVDGEKCRLTEQDVERREGDVVVERMKPQPRAEGDLPSDRPQHVLERAALRVEAPAPDHPVARLQLLLRGEHETAKLGDDLKVFDGCVVHGNEVGGMEERAACSEPLAMFSACAMSPSVIISVTPAMGVCTRKTTTAASADHPVIFTADSVRQPWHTEGMGFLTSRVLMPLVARLGSRTIIGVGGALFLLNMLIPDPLPLIDEFLILAGTIVLSRMAARSGATGATGAKGATGATGATRCDGCAEARRQGIDDSSLTVLGGRR